MYGTQHPVVLYLGNISLLANTFRHSLNFFLFYLFNKKFKELANCRLVINFNNSSKQNPTNKSSNLYILEGDIPRTETNLDLLSLQCINLENYVTRL